MPTPGKGEGKEKGQRAKGEGEGQRAKVEGKDGRGKVEGEPEDGGAEGAMEERERPGPSEMDELQFPSDLLPPHALPPSPHYTLPSQDIRHVSTSKTGGIIPENNHIMFAGTT